VLLDLLCVGPRRCICVSGLSERGLAQLWGCRHVRHTVRGIWLWLWPVRVPVTE